MIKVTMNLTERDVENTDALYSTLRARSKAHAVSIALSLARYLVEAIRKPGTQLLLRHDDGSVERIVVPELEVTSSDRERRGSHRQREKVAAVA